MSEIDRHMDCYPHTLALSSSQTRPILRLPTFSVLATTTMRPTILALTLLTALPALAQPTIVSEPESQEGVSLTIYNQNFAVVGKQRSIALEQGLNVVRFEGVAAQIDPTSPAG